MPTVAAARLACVVVFAAFAYEAAAAEVPEVPSDDIFGFTMPTDVGNLGDLDFANENDGRVGKRGGAYNVLNAKYELSNTFAPDWWGAVSLFGSRYFVRGVPDLADVNRVAFDGLSFEIEHRVIKRSQSNPFALSLSVEPRWSRIDSVSGLPSYAFNAQFKVFVDAVVIPDKLYWASNVIWAPQRAEDPSDRDRWLSSSSTLISSAFTYQTSSKFFLGVEARYLGAFNSLLPTQQAGHALYVGPTLLWKVTDKVAFNTTFQPQISGRSTTNPTLRLDLDNFERLQFRIKLAVSLK
jgi:hypothetical protein